MAISRFKTSSVAQGLPKYQKLWDGSTLLFDSDFESIASYTVSSGTSAGITFSGIPSTYKHLQIRGLMRFSGNDGGFGLAFNNDTNDGNYYSHIFTNNGSSTNTGSWGTNFIGWTVPTNSTTAGVFAGFVIDILDYKSTVKNKTARVLSGHDSNGSNTSKIIFSSMVWSNTSAIDTIKLDATSQGSTSLFGTNTTFALYGIKD